LYLTGDPGGGYVEIPTAGNCVPGGYQSFIESEGLVYAEGAVTVSTLNWPFATTAGDTGKMFAYVLYVSSPNLATSLGVAPASGYTRGLAAGWSLDSQLSSVAYCNQSLVECLNIKENGTVMAVTAQPAGLASSAYIKGDFAHVMVIGGYNGTEIMTANLVENSGTTWLMDFAGSTANKSLTCPVTVSIFSTADGFGRYTQTLSINIDGTVTDTALGYIARSWTTVGISIQSGTPYQTTTSGPTRYYGNAPIQVNVKLSGPLVGNVTITASGFNTTNPSVDPYLSSTIQANTFYTIPVHFRNAEISVAQIGTGVFDYSVLTGQEALDYLMGGP
jgi:hypothetical protein